jgi:hypothetical protein
MTIVLKFPRVADVLQSFAASIGNDFVGYQNHVHRVLNYFMAINGSESELPMAVLVAAPFHDLGIWTHSTFDYIAPSVRLAKAHLVEHELESLTSEVELLITEHHKLLPYDGPFAKTVENYRKADWIDVSLGLVNFGLPRGFVRSVKAAFPDGGFHRRLVELAGLRLLRSPSSPLPMVHW